MNTRTPTATVKSIKVTSASAAYHRRLYLAPAVLQKRERQETAERGEQKMSEGEQIKQGGKEDPGGRRRSKGN